MVDHFTTVVKYKMSDHSMSVAAGSPSRAARFVNMSTSRVIITCAVTGAIHTPSMSPYLPVSANEIAEAAIGAAEAGAAIVHLHARNPETGKPDQSPEAFGRF